MSFLCMKVLNWRDIGGPDWVWFTGAGDCACKVLEWGGLGGALDVYIGFKVALLFWARGEIIWS